MSTEKRNTILLVEDDALVAETEAKAISRFGYEVIIANSGEQAVELASFNEKVSLIIMDIDLGMGLSGPEAAAQILMSRSLPIIFLTSHSERAMVEKVCGITHYGYIVKNSGDFVLQSSVEIAFSLFEANEKLRNELADHRRTEETLRETNEYLQNLFNYANAPIIVWDSQFRITRFNHAFEELTGRSEEEVLGKSLEILFPLERADKSMALIRKTLTGERWETVEIKIEHKDESVRTVLWNSATLFASDGRTPAATIAQGQDITERKTAEEALRETNEYLQNLFNYANAPIIVWDPQFRITRFNHAFEELTGRSEKEVLGESLEILFPLERADKSMALIRKTLTGERWETVEIKIQHKDESVRTVLWNSATLFAPDGKTPVATMAQGQDITERKSAEEALRETNEYLQNLFNYANAPIIVWDPQFRITRFNHAFEELTGRSEEEVLGKSLEILFPLGRADKAMALIRKTLTGERWETVEIKIEHKDESVRTVLWNSATLFAADGKTPVATIAQGQDITERKTAEEALRETNEYLQNLFNYANAPIIVWDPLFRITRFNHAFEELTGRNEKEVLGESLEILFPLERADKSMALIRKTLTGERWETVEIKIQHKDESVRTVLWNSATLFAPDGKTPVATIAQGQDITDRKQVEAEREQLIADLQSALDQIKTLRGIVPICANCKKIRDDKGYWEQVESYVTKHTEARFSHGMCPDCIEKLYPAFAKNKKRDVFTTSSEG